MKIKSKKVNKKLLFIFNLEIFLVLLSSSCAWLNSGVVFGTTENSRYQQRYDSAPGHKDADMATENARVTLEKTSKRGNPTSYTIKGKTYRVMKNADGFVQEGYASWYGKKFHGHATANGEIYDMYKMTAAHKTLPLPSFVRVTNLSNGKSVIVRVNDRGPFHNNRIIDLSYAAAKKLGINGVEKVKLEVINPLTYNKGNYKLPKDKKAFLQIGVYSKSKTADEVCKKVKKLNFNCRIVSVDNLYKVQVGGFVDAKSLALATRDLKQIGFSKGILLLEAR